MTRTEYIETIIKIFRAKYKPSEVELEEVKLALEMMPDREVLFMPKQPFFPTDPPNPYERPVTVMYGVQMSETTWYDSNATVTTTTKKEDKK
jgi:hypothetical protein